MAISIHDYIIICFLFHRFSFWFLFFTCFPRAIACQQLLNQPAFHGVIQKITHTSFFFLDTVYIIIYIYFSKKISIISSILAESFDSDVGMAGGGILGTGTVGVGSSALERVGADALDRVTCTSGNHCVWGGIQSYPFVAR